MRAWTALVAAATLGGCSDSIAPSHLDSVRFVAVTGGADHSCALTEGGSAYCWGNNRAGAVGIRSSGSLALAPEPVVVGPFSLGTLDAGPGISCTLLTNGSALCWGNGEPTPQQSFSEKPVRTLSVGDFGCGLSADSLTSCWTDPGSQAHLVQATKFRSLSVGGFACGVTAGGPAECWGAADLTAAPVPGGFVFRTVSVGGQHACGILEDGVIACWGDNRRGQLGDFTTTSRTTPAPVGSNQRYVAVSAGDRHTCAIAEDGLAYCWGEAFDGRLGYGGFAGYLSAPTRVRGGDFPADGRWLAIAAGASHSCGVGTDQHVYCWGANGGGQLGDGTTEVRSQPRLTGADND